MASKTPKASQSAEAATAVGTAFISYSRDNNEFVDRLEAALKKRNVHVLRDRHDIAKAEDWWLRLEQLIREADSIVLVLSPSSMASAVTQREIAFAATLNKRVLPIVAAPLAGVQVPDAISKLNYVFFIAEPRAGASGDFEQASDQLLEALTTDLGWIREHTDLGEAAHRWEAGKRPAHLLLRGPALDAAERWLAARPKGAVAPTALQREYLLAGRQNATKRLRIGIGISLAVAVVSVGLAALAWVQKQAAVTAQKESFVRQADLSASLAFRLYEQGDGLLGLKVASMGMPEQITDGTPLQPRLALALQRGAAMIQEEAGLRHPEGQIDDIAWSPDGRFIATATVADGPRLWRAADGALLRAFGSGLPSAEAKMADPRMLSFSADNRRLAMQVDNRVQVWELAGLDGVGGVQAGPRLDVPCPDVTMRAVALSPDGRFVAARCGDGLRVWQVEGGRAVWSLPVALNPDNGEPEGGWPEVAFVRGGEALFMLRPGEARLLQKLGSATPQVMNLPRLAALDGTARVEAVPESDDVLVVGQQGFARASLGEQQVIYRMAAQARPGEWWVRQGTGTARVMVAWQPNGRGALSYVLADARNGATMEKGRMRFLSAGPEPHVDSVDLSSDGRVLAIGTTAGVAALQLNRMAAMDGKSNVDQLEGSALVALDEPCSIASAASSRVLMAPDGARVATACDGLTRVRLLKGPVAAMLGTSGDDFPRIAGTAPATEGMVRLVMTGSGRWVFELATGATPLGASRMQTPALDAEMDRWAVAERAGTVYWIDVNGRAGAWDAASGQLTRFEGSYASARAMRIGSDGRKAAVLAADGQLVHLALGQAKPALQAPLLPRPAGAGDIAPIRYDIGPDLRSVALLTADLKDAYRDLRRYAVVLTAANGSGPAQAHCLIPARGQPTAVLLGGPVDAPQLYVMDQSRTLATAPLAQTLAAGGAPTPRATGGAPVKVQPCPDNLAQALYDSSDLEVNQYTERTAILAGHGGQVLHSMGEWAPLELIDVTSGQSLTDLVNRHAANRPVAVSADGALVAVALELGNGVAVFDAATGTLLQRRLTSALVDPKPDALAFEPSGDAVHARLADGRVQVIPLQLKRGTELLKAIRELGTGPMTDAERRQIYELRKRFPRVAASG